MLADCRLTPSQLIREVKRRFCELPPAALVTFDAPGGVVRGADLDIRINPGQQCRVRVVHDDAQSFTLATLEGHFEAGRITFGAYRNPAGDVIFHIRSRARSATTAQRIGFLAIGDAMQTNTWTDFIVNTAALAGSRVQGVIHADTEAVEPHDDDEQPLDSPTFRAAGD